MVMWEYYTRSHIVGIILFQQLRAKFCSHYRILAMPMPPNFDPMWHVPQDNNKHNYFCPNQTMDTVFKITYSVVNSVRNQIYVTYTTEAVYIFINHFEDN